MLQNAQYYREPTFLYPLQSHPSYWFHVGKTEGKQVIMGLLDSKFRLVVFDDKGNLMEVNECDLAIPLKGCDRVNDLDSMYVEIAQKVAKVRRERNWLDEPIGVKRFWLPKLHVGIGDFPDELQEYVVNRGFSGAVEEDDLEASLEGWKEESLFVFWWGQSFDIDCRGKVSSS